MKSNDSTPDFDGATPTDSEPLHSETSPFDALAGPSTPTENGTEAEPLPGAPFVPDDEVGVEPPYVEPRGSRWPLLLFLLLLIGLGGGAFYYKKKADEREARRFAPIVMPERLAIVPNAWSAVTLATRLKNSGKIRDEAAFIESAKEIGLDSIAQGGYLLPEIAGPRELAGVFKAGPTHQKAVFPEGFTGLQIAARLQKEGFAGASALDALIYPPSGFSPYEGTLFPDTYWLPLGASGKVLIAAMQDKFAQVVKKLPRPLPKVKGKTLTTRQIVTIASLIERETSSKAEMPQIAGVMINRLNKPMRLQIDATVQYARIMQDKDHKERLYFKDLKIDSPFNTYRNDGLPPTPICNPGQDALRAAARPAQTGALFYVYSPKLKHHLFSKDFDGHRHNIALVRRERAAIEGETGN